MKIEIIDLDSGKVEKVINIIDGKFFISLDDNDQIVISSKPPADPVPLPEIPQAA